MKEKRVKEKGNGKRNCEGEEKREWEKGRRNYERGDVRQGKKKEGIVKEER